MLVLNRLDILKRDWESQRLSLLDIILIITLCHRKGYILLRLKWLIPSNVDLWTQCKKVMQRSFRLLGLTLLTNTVRYSGELGAYILSLDNENFSNFTNPRFSHHYRLLRLALWVHDQQEEAGKWESSMKNTDFKVLKWCSFSISSCWLL